MTPKIASAFSQITVLSVFLPSISTSLRTVPSLGVEVIDNSIRNHLQQASQDFFTCIIWSTAVLGVGCIFELPEILFEIWPKTFWWFTSESKERHDKFERRIKLVGLVGWVLVAAGIMGEGVFESLQNQAEGQVQTFNDILLQDARYTASTASEAAHDAVESAAVSLKIANKAESNLATALERANEAEKEEAELKRLVGLRRLSLDQQERISKACKGTGREMVNISSYGMDPEGRALAMQIGHSIWNHTFSVTIDNTGTLSTAIEEGIFIRGSEHEMPLMTCIQKVLVNIGGLEDVSINAPTSVFTGIRGSHNIKGSHTMKGMGSTEPAPILPAGSPIELFVAIRPIQKMELKR